MLWVEDPGQIHFPLFWCHWATVSPYLWSGPATFPLTSPETPDSRWGNRGDVDLHYNVRGRQRTPHLSSLWNTRNTLRQRHYWELTAPWPLRAPFQGEMPKTCPPILPKASKMCSQPLDNGKHAQKKNLPNKRNYSSPIFLPLWIHWLQSSKYCFKVFLKHVLCFLCQPWSWHSLANTVSTISSTWVHG